jgi:N-acetylglucosaminyl-diphospho-decaprenol L-rhamnosyltransferase
LSQAMAEPKTLDVLVALVTYNSADVVVDLIKSLPAALKGCSWQLVVADNASRDGTIGVIRTLAPDAVIVEMGRNAGYAAGINAAVSAGTHSRSILVLNPDTRLGAESVNVMLQRLQDPGIGIVVPRLLWGEGALVHTLRREPNIRRALGDAILGWRRAGRFETWGEIVVADECYTNDSTADWAAGPAMLISRICLETCGPWDESFFLYSEETEFCLRARDHGFRLILTPGASVVHLGGESQVAPHLHSLVVVNRIKLYSRRHGRFATSAFWSIAVLRSASRAAFGRHAERAALRTLLSRRRMRYAARLAAG